MKTRDPKRIPRILKKLQELWEKYPDLRLGQLIMNIDGTNQDFWHVEDSEWEKKITRCRQTWSTSSRNSYQEQEKVVRELLEEGNPAIVATQGERGYQALFNVLTDNDIGDDD